LEKIADFWSGATGGPPAYQGPMPWKHIPLKLEEKHFEAWLGLWARHCQIHLPEVEGREMTELAEAIGQRLRHIIAANVEE
jgi:hemoglobin